MKNICLTILNINAKGGEERMCTTLANSLLNAGYNVFIASLQSHHDIPSFYHINKNVKVVHVLGSFIKRRINEFFPLIKYRERGFESFLRKNQINIVIDVDTDLTPFTSPIIKKLGLKHIAWDHFYYGRFKEREQSKIILPYLKNAVDKLVVLTKDDERQYREEAKIPSNKIVQIYNSSPIEEDYKYKHDSKIVLAMGRLTYQKGFDTLIDAWSLIANVVGDWTLKIVGDGEEKQNLLSLVEKHGLKNVEISSATKDPKKEYLNASLFVLSSRYEGLGLVLLEAANMSLPLVSFDCDNGPREIIKDGVNGFLVEPGNIQQLAEKLKQLIENDQLRDKMSDKSLPCMTNFRSEHILKQWINLIEMI